MNQSESLKNLTGALIEAQKGFGSIEKNKKAAYGKYADLSEVYNKTKPALDANGLRMMITLETPNDPQMTYLKGTLYHAPSGEWIASRVPFPMTGKKPTEIGAYMTYMRRYLYCCLIGVVSDEDVEGDELNEAAPDPATPRVKLIDEAQIEELNGFLSQLPEAEKFILKQYPRLSDMPVSKYEEWIPRLETALHAKKANEPSTD